MQSPACSFSFKGNPASATEESASLGLHFFIVFYPKYRNKFGRLLTYS